MDIITITDGVLWINWFLVIIIVIGEGLLAVKLISKRTINSYFDRKLKKYQHNLDLLADETRLNFSRMNQDFNLWTIKRHEAYLKLYEALARANKLFQSISIFPPYLTEETFTELKAYNKTEIINLLHEYNVKDIEFQEICNLWDSNNKESAILKIFECNKAHKEKQCENALNEIINLFEMSSIYLTDSIEEAIGKLRINFMKQFSIHTYDKISKEDRFVVKLDLYEKINAELKNISSLMKKELSGGYKIEKE